MLYNLIGGPHYKLSKLSLFMLFAGLECGTPDSPTPTACSHPTHRPATSNVAQDGVTLSKLERRHTKFLNSPAPPPIPTLAITGEACGVGSGVRTDNPATGTPAQRRRITGGGAAGGGPCQIATGRSFHCAGHMKC